MKGVLFTGILFLIILAVYFKFAHPKVVGEAEPGSGFGYSED